MLSTPVGQRRLLILELLKDPARHFPPRRHTDPAADGVTAAAVADRLGVDRAVADAHLSLLAALGLLRTKRIRRRTHYRRDEIRIAEVARVIEKGW
ncbi:ArsR family transcriptional regulator [Streptomyces longwoodensis]|uniref:ArsR family transcriptional regulator n=1 Tax=Streptomyces longwoodensis TaxID=68231 RepID=A0A101R4H5_9ACTN|nr:ArsR family transcriptional regulator [Streptomyces longwoodensis]KUN41538.1 ArsR family transcriptional regulator [Streptomyces longwoodensis]